MNAEFQWWLLILGIVIGGALVYLVLADLQGDRDEDELETEDETESADEAEGDVADLLLGDEFGADIEHETGWSEPADLAPSVIAEPAREHGRASVDEPTVQRDGAQGETPVADLP